MCLYAESSLSTVPHVPNPEIFLSLLVVGPLFVVLYLVVRAAVAGGIRDARSHDENRPAPDTRRSGV